MMIDALIVDILIGDLEKEQSANGAFYSGFRISRQDAYRFNPFVPLVHLQVLSIFLANDNRRLNKLFSISHQQLSETRP